MKVISILFFCCYSISLAAQTNHSKSFQFVLEDGKIGKEYIFEGNAKNQPDSLVLIYLGEIKADGGKGVKFLTSRWFWGSSQRATSRIIVFNNKNQYLGDYYLNMTSDIPDKITGGALVFVNSPENKCDPSLKTRISFKKGIPKRLFVRCKDNLGVIYSFAQNL
jgi:hypothetical protein